MNKQSKNLTILIPIILAVLGIGYVIYKNNTFHLSSLEATPIPLTEDQKRMPENALNGLEIAEGLEISAFATEPTIVNPTNIDVDARGRVWVCEAYNYRPAINGNPTKKEGDRIVILEDKNGDGKAEISKVFYQGPEINSPLGIAVLGNKVYVSQSPYVWIFTDENGDDKADKKEILFEGIEGEQHDHGMHAITFGPDGKLYFNFGNEGKQLKDKNGKFVKDKDGKEINPKNFKQGLMFRCDLDGSNVEVLGQNFRNNFELAVDSYGTIWQSDNDDDGNKSTRINYVMPHGNYGYTDELTRAGWRAPRTNMEDSIPQKHWHLNDPGVVPNLLQTGAGSPTGIIVYEGNLLPKTFQNQIIHCDAGPNVVRSYPVTNDGAGYKATITNIVKGLYDQWFRPSDVCAAPDGSIFISDWYDPGVGGHEAGDQAKGRIYRVAPENTPYKVTDNDLSSVAGAINGLQSPNQATRYLSFITLTKFGNAAIPDLENLFNTAENPRMKARAFWLLVNSPNGKKYVDAAAKDTNPDIRIIAIRGANLFNKGIIETVTSLANDKDAQVRRECILALRNNKAPEAAKLWAQLAMQHNGSDRWYLEALGIGAEGQSQLFFSEYLKLNANPLTTAAGKDIVWRTRSPEALPFLASLATDPNTKLTNRLRYFREFDFIQSSKKDGFLLKMLEGNSSGQLELNKLVLGILDVNVVTNSENAQNALKNVVNSLPVNEEYLSLVDKYSLVDQKDKLYNLVIKHEGPGEGMYPTRTLLKIGGEPMLGNALNTLNETARVNILMGLRYVGSKEAVELLNSTAFNTKQSGKVRKTAFKYLGNTGLGENMVFNYLRNNNIPKAYIPAAVESVSGSWKKAVRDEARKYLGVVKANDGKPLPSIVELSKLKGNIDNGKTVFKNYCTVCHQVNNEGVDFGPKLSQIGAKLTKESILTSIIHPDLGISFGYEGWNIILKDGTPLSGIISSKTETDIILKSPGGAASQNIKTSNIKTMTQMDTSVMTAGLQESMTTQELVDLAEYLKSLK